MILRCSTLTTPHSDGFCTRAVCLSFLLISRTGLNPMMALNSLAVIPQESLGMLPPPNNLPALAMLPVTFGLFGAPDWYDLPIFALLGLLGR